MARSAATAVGAFALVAACAAVAVGRQLPLEPAKERGASVTGAFEGWYPNADGTFTLLVGYYNRNRSEILDIPVGPNNRIEPAGPDHGQPTHFLPRRQWGVFTIVVPKDFGTKKFTWTLTANGQTTELPLWLNPKYQVEPFKDPAMGNTPPVLKFSENGPELTGPPRGFALTLNGTSGQMVSFPVWVSDKGGNAEEAGGAAAAALGVPAAGGRGLAPRVTLTLSHHRGPGQIKFTEPRPKIDVGAGGKATATAIFSAPGEYVVRVQANDTSGEGGGGFQCCWTNAHVKVIVK
jgi:hypothetical protein